MPTGIYINYPIFLRQSLARTEKVPWDVKKMAFSANRSKRMRRRLFGAMHDKIWQLSEIILTRTKYEYG